MAKATHFIKTRDEGLCHYMQPNGISYDVKAWKDKKGQWRLAERTLGARYGQIITNVVFAQSLKLRAEQWDRIKAGTEPRINGFYAEIPNEIENGLVS